MWYGCTHGQSVTCSDVIFDREQNPIWRPGAILKNENRHNSAAFWDIFTKFGVPLTMVSPLHAGTSFLAYDKIQDGGQKPFWKKTKNRNSSANI